MIDDAALSLVTPENAAQIAKALCADDVPMLVERLNSAEDKIRYPAFLLLRAHSSESADLLPFWDELAGKLTSENSYQRSLGAMLLAASARHDSAGRMRSTLPRFLALLNDPKPITVRQCTQALPEILAAQPELAREIASAILAVDLLGFKDTMRKLILEDFLDALVIVRETAPSAALEEYFFSALSGSILDEKAKKQLRTKLSI